MAYKTFANGFPLPASDLNNYLMNQSVIVFASAAARTSAIPTPVEGMLTYLEDTNAYEGWTGAAWVNINDNTAAIPKSLLTTTGDLIVASGASTPARLGIGSAGQVLQSTGTTLSWATVSGGGMTQISTGTITSSQVNLSSIPQTYKKLRLVFTNTTSTNASYSSAILKFNDDNGNNYYEGQVRAEIYDASWLGAWGAGTGIPAGIAETSYWEFDTYTLTSEIKTATGQRTFRRPSSQLLNAGLLQGFYKGSSALTKINIIPSSNFSSTYTLFGIS